MNKLASALEWTPGELFGIAAAGGAGTFGGVRLLSEILKKVQGQQAPEQQKSVKLMTNFGAPPEMQGLRHQPEGQHEYEATGFSSPKTAFEISPPADGTTSGYISSLLPLLAGVPAGFLGAKYTYDKYKGSEMDKKTEQAKQQYLQQLATTQQQMKTAAATPRVDSFCEAVCQELNAGAF